jgi:hypothetical protein
VGGGAQDGAGRVLGAPPARSPRRLAHAAHGEAALRLRDDVIAAITIGGGEAGEAGEARRESRGSAST